jgi:hypothetical protein
MVECNVSKEQLIQLYHDDSPDFVLLNTGHNKLCQQQILHLVSNDDLIVDRDIINHLFDTYPNIHNELFTLFANGNEYCNYTDSYCTLSQLKVDYIIAYIGTMDVFARATILRHTLIRQTLTPEKQQDRDKLKFCYLNYNHEWQLLFDILNNKATHTQEQFHWFLNNIPVYPTEKHIDICVRFKQRKYVDMYINSLPEHIIQYINSKTW